MTIEKAVVVGAGTYGAVYISYLRAHGVDVVGILDDAPTKQGVCLKGVPVIGRLDKLGELRRSGVDSVYVPVGNNAFRRKVLREAVRVGLQVPSFIHGSCVVATDVIFGYAFYSLPGTIIMPDVSIGDGVMISMGARIAHHTTIGSGSFLSTGVAVGASIEVGEEVYFGMNATAVTGKCTKIGSKAVVGACSNVLRDVPAGVTIAGNPARILVV